MSGLAELEMLASDEEDRSDASVTMIDRFFDKLRISITDGAFVKITLSRKRGNGELRNIYGRLVELKSGTAMSFTLRCANKDVTRNEPPETVRRVLGKWLEEDFAEAHLFTTTGDWKLRATHDGTWSMKASKPVFSASLPMSHDRPKVRALANAPFLEKLGVTASDGTARAGMADKLRQVERFVEILGHLIDGSTLREAKEIAVFDMGAGKGYLTFATHEFFRARGAQATVTGVEQRGELAAQVNLIAAELKTDGLTFAEGSIGNFALPETVDVLIALHACDTATDDAIAAGVNAGAKLIVVSPCCQKEVRRQLCPPEVLASILRHGILAERQAEILTDGIRAIALEAAGYDTSVFEFISNDHTGKNVMIAATRRHSSKDTAGVRGELREVMRFFGLGTQRLVELLGFGDSKSS